jgi:hypothetical protein
MPNYPFKFSPILRLTKSKMLYHSLLINLVEIDQVYTDVGYTIEYTGEMMPELHCYLHNSL